MLNSVEHEKSFITSRSVHLEVPVLCNSACSFIPGPDPPDREYSSMDSWYSVSPGVYWNRHILSFKEKKTLL